MLLEYLKNFIVTHRCIVAEVFTQEHIFFPQICGAPNSSYSCRVPVTVISSSVTLFTCPNLAALPHLFVARKTASFHTVFPETDFLSFRLRDIQVCFIPETELSGCGMRNHIRDFPMTGTRMWEREC